tara:strand:- start:1141 stop:1686 length:546 start_codon:yes stop_codon:yes gene_type:complete
MVNPDGKVVQQGFAAPQGYQSGGILSEIQDSDIAQGVEQKTQPPMPDWANRALDPKTPVLEDKETGELQTVKTMSREVQGKEYLFPTIRLVGKELKKYDEEEALSIALKKKDYIMFDTPEEATEWSKNFSSQVQKLRNLQQPKMPSEPITSPMATVDQQQEPMLPMLDQETGFAEQQNVGM